MAEWLLLRMPRAADEPAEWLVCDAQGFATGAALRGTLTEAAAQAPGRRVAVLVSAADVLLATVDLPPRAGNRALQMARFALEEQLLGDLDAQHFALGRRSDDSHTPVAVATRAMMQSWLEGLASVGIRPELLCTDTALLPAQPMQTVAWIDGDQLTLVPQRPLAEAAAQASATGAAASADAVPCLPADDPAGALALALGDLPLDGVDLTVYASPSDWARCSAAWEALRPGLSALHVQLLSGGALPWLAPQLVSAPPLNLLQGEFETHHSGGASWQRWKLPAALAAALLLLFAGERAYALWSLQRAEADTDTQLAQIAQLAAPGTQVDPSALRRLVATQLTGGAQSDGGPLMQSLQSLSRALGNGESRVRSLGFREGNTDLLVRARDAQALERIRQALRSDGLNADVTGGGAAAGGQYEGRLQIRNGGQK